MPSESDKRADHEMCSSDHGRLRCVRFASVRSVTTALSGESGTAVWHRSDRDRKGFDPTFCKTSACYSAKVRLYQPRDAGTRLRDRRFLTSVAGAVVSAKLWLQFLFMVFVIRSVTPECVRSASDENRQSPSSTPNAAARAAA